MSCDKPTELWVFVGFLIPTLSRLMMVIQLIPKGNTVQMCGGPNPNGWLGPWVTDTILGLLVPVMIVLSLTVTGVPMFGVALQGGRHFLCSASPVPPSRSLWSDIVDQIAGIWRKHGNTQCNACLNEDSGVEGHTF